MEYTPEQRAIIQRIGELSAQIDTAAAAHQAAQAAVGHNLTDAVTALLTAIEHSSEIMVLQMRHGDLWREFLDTL